MVVNPGLPLPKERNKWKWIFLILLMFGIFLLVFLGLFLRWYILREEVLVKEFIMNETAFNISLSSVQSSVDSMISSRLTSNIQTSVKTSPTSDLVMSSFINSLILSRQSTSTTTSTTTTLSIWYISYRMTVPEKFKKCDPRERNDTYNPCIVINASCCPCQSEQIVEGELKWVQWGGKVDAINRIYYKNGGLTTPDYYEINLHNCSQDVVCTMAPSAAGCRYTAECIAGRCVLPGRY